MSESSGLAVPLTQLIPVDLIPIDLIEPSEELMDLLARILVTRFESQKLASGGHVEIGISVADEAVFKLPGLDGILFVVGGPAAQTISLGAKFDSNSLSISVGAGARLRFSPEILRPVCRGDEGKWKDDSARQFSEIIIDAGVMVDSNGNVSFAGSNAFSLKPSSIGDSGFVVEGSLALDLSENESLPETLALGLGPTWRGAVFKTLSLHLPADIDVPIVPSSLTLRNFHIGSGGVSGSVTGVWNPTISDSGISGDGTGKLFGITFALESIRVSLLQNSFTECDLKGFLQLPFFNHVLQVSIGFGLNGNLSLAIDRPGGLTDFTLAVGGFDIAKVAVSSIGVTQNEGVQRLKISGSITPLVGNLEWPTFQIKELAIDSKGNVHIEGGWLNLSKQKPLNFHGFQVEITKLGFGKTEDGGKWIGFSGSAKLVEGLPAGASVEGLRIIWYDDESNRAPKVTFNGIGIEFAVPKVLEFKGAISYREPYDVEITLPDDRTGKETVQRIDGAIRLKLVSLDLEVDGKLVVGHATSNGLRPDYNFFAIYVGVELPAGIPLFATGLGLYGFAGLFATQMEPNKRPDEGWYDNPDGSAGWYKRGEVGITDLANKWDPQLGSLAFGLGTTIGTLPDNGTSFHGKFLLVIVFPGPIVMLEGRGDLLKKRTEQKEGAEATTRTTSEPLFRALAILDGRQGTFTIGLDAQYKYDNPGGKLIDIRGSAEVFFHFHDASAWHIYIGRKTPEEYRIHALLFSIFKANAYFMLQGKNPILQTGAFIGYKFKASFGPVSVQLEAFIQGDASISLKPTHFYGFLGLRGSIKVAVFGLGFELTVGASIAADVFDPFVIEAKLEVVVKLFWPIPPINVHLTLKWGPKLIAPPLPLPLKEIAVEHFKVTTSWPLPKKTLEGIKEIPGFFLPDYEDKDDFLRPDGSKSPTEVPADLSKVPIVPLDSRPHVTFARHVNDDAMVGVNPGERNTKPRTDTDVAPEWETIGDPTDNTSPVRVRFGLESLTLEKYEAGVWSTVASSPSSDPNKALYGSWAPNASLTGDGSGIDQTKLWVWSKNPFDYTRHAGGAWDEWITEQVPNYPCVPPAPDQEICVDVSDLDPTTIPSGIWQSADIPGLTITWQTSDGSIDPNNFTIGLPPDTKGVTITPSGDHEERFRECVNFRRYSTGAGFNPRIEFGTKFFVSAPPASSTSIVMANGQAGLACGQELVITLRQPSSNVVMLFTQGGTGQVEVLRIDGVSLEIAPIPSRNLAGVRIPISSISRIIVSTNGETILHEICYEYPRVTITGSTSGGEVLIPTSNADGSVSLNGVGLSSIQVNTWNTSKPEETPDGESPTGIEKICITLPPDSEEIKRREEMNKHLVDEMARWSQEDFIFEPHTIYRLAVVTTVEAKSNLNLESENPGKPNIPWASDPQKKVWTRGPLTQTQYSYFRTEGPPGLVSLSMPEGFPKSSTEITVNGTKEPNPPFDSGLDKLDPYVKQTMPPTVPPEGKPPLLPRPVYRAYDVGVQFNESYVDLMYRIAQRDLGLYLFNSNNQPVRDALGRLVILTNHWSAQEELTLTETDQRWVSTVNQSTCAKIDEPSIPHSKTLTSADEAQVLDQDTVYEARLSPLLLQEDFAAYNSGTVIVGPSGKLGGWEIHDEGTTNGPSRWEVRQEGTPPAKFIVQTSAIAGGNDDRRDPNKPGTTLLRADNPALAADHADQPGNWTDYRLSVYLRAMTSDDAIGIVFRYKDAANYYRFSMDRERHYRRVIRVVDKNITVLRDDDFTYRQNVDYLVTVEAIGSSLRVYQDGALVFDVLDDAIAKGRVGVYCWNNAGARFSNVRVDDFRSGDSKAPVVYRFQFTTSRFTNFFHQLHSYQDETWKQSVSAAIDMSTYFSQALVVNAGTQLSDVSESEARAYEAVASQILGSEMYKMPVTAEITRVEQSEKAVAFLLRSPEPIDWTRAEFEVLRTDRRIPAPQLPDVVKLTDVVTTPIPSVSLLLRDATNLTGYSIQQRVLPGPLAEDGPPSLLIESFGGSDSGVLFWEEFGPNALDKYLIVAEQPPGSAVPKWQVSKGRIEEIADYRGGQPADDLWKRPGTMAVLRFESWRNVRLTLTFQTNSQRDIGFVFRYQDENSYYRVSFSRYDATRNASIRRLMKKVNGVATVLWEDETPHETTKPTMLVVETYQDRLIGLLDHRFLFSVRDSDLVQGSVGLYCWGNSQAFFEGLQIESLESDPILWQPSLADIRELRVFDEDGAFDGPSQWSASGGVLTQGSHIYSKGGSWQELPGAGTDIGVGGNGAVWLIGSDKTSGGYGIYHWTGITWDNIVGAAVRVAVDSEGLAWVVNENREIYHRSHDNKWLPIPGAAQDIGIGPGTPPYIIGTTPSGGGFDISYLDNGSWRPIEGAGLRLAVAPNGSPWVVNDAQYIFMYDWNSLRWEKIPGLANDIGVGADGSVWIVGTDPAPGGFRIGRWNGVAWEMESDTGAVGISVGPEGNPWLVSDTNKIFTWEGNIRHKPGTYALGGSATWGDVEISVKTRSDDEGALGVMLRYVDADNYLRFSIDRRGNYRRLIKKMAGKVTTLWEEPWQYSTGRLYDLTIAVIGGSIEIYLDGTLLTRVYDADLRFGQVALYSYANAGAKFSNLVVRDVSRRVGRWIIRDDAVLGRPSRWRLAGGELSQVSSIGETDPLTAMGTHAVAGDPLWRDYQLQVRLRSDDQSALGLIFRYVDDHNYYRFSVDTKQNIQRLIKVADKNITKLWDQPGNFKVSEPFTLTVDAIGSKFVGYKDGQQLFEVTDSTHATGQVGLYAWANPAARFEWFQVNMPPLEMAALFRDSFGESDLNGWEFIDDGTLDRPSKWNVVDGTLRQTSNIHSRPGGSIEYGTQFVVSNRNWADFVVSVSMESPAGGAIGLVVRYTTGGYYRFVMNSQAGYRQFIKQQGAQATVLWQDQVAYERNRSHDLTFVALGATLRGYLNGVPIFAIVDRDVTSGSIGLFSASNPDARFSHVQAYPVAYLSKEFLLEDSFDLLVPGPWTFVDEGTQGGSSEWTVIRGQLQQNGKIGAHPTKPLKSGTYAVAGETSWSDYRFSASLRSGPTGAIGVVCRYQDADNYYRFSMDRSHRRFIKNVGGSGSVLWEDGVQFSEDRVYIVTVDCEHDRITVYLDGARIFQVQDGDVPAGRVGLYCSANQQAKFDEVHIAAPSWASFYKFEKEPQMPAGTKIRIYAEGIAQKLPAQGPDVALRFAAKPGESLRTRFRADGVEIRVTNELGKSLHRRYFVPSSDYSNVGVRFLRKTDGTNFVLVPQAGAEFSTGEYRFRFTYSKKLSDLAMLSQAGDESPEAATLNIPWETSNQ